MGEGALGSGSILPSMTYLKDRLTSRISSTAKYASVGIPVSPRPPCARTSTITITGREEKRLKSSVISRSDDRRRGPVW